LTHSYLLIENVDSIGLLQTHPRKKSSLVINLRGRK